MTDNRWEWDDMHWSDPAWVADRRAEVEAEIRAERGEAWWQANARFHDANWEAALFQLGVL